MTTEYHGRPTGMSLVSFILAELKPKGPLLTTFNIITAPIIIVGFVLIVIRLAYGLGSITNLSQEYPWGIWIAYDVITGVSFAGGAYILTFAVYIMGKKKYQPIVRATVLNGFLAYMFYAIALTLDIGRPWHIINPIIGNSFGYNSVLFLVAWHFLLYMISEFLEFAPAIAQWANMPRLKKALDKATVLVVIFGVTLSTGHQSGVGALFLIAPSKIHPLWYTEFIPLLFLISSIFSGISMIIIEGSVSHRVFRDQIDPTKHHDFDTIVLHLGRGAAVTLFVYFFLMVAAFIHGHRWHYIGTGWFNWYLVEMLGFVAFPCYLYAKAFKDSNVRLTQIAAVVSLLGILLNRLNISLIAYNWNISAIYIPTVYEIIVTLTILFAELWVFRWGINRFPVLRGDSH
ncbi:MAG: polysulfide reductase NrfD [Deltaproteobacteria bacterium]|nr:polysulfide reductase NrfD [Deltaproteobacteria bacterium]